MAVGGEGFAESGLWSAARRIHVAPTARQPCLRRISWRRLGLTRRKRDRRSGDQYCRAKTRRHAKRGGAEQVGFAWNFRMNHGTSPCCAGYVLKAKKRFHNLSILVRSTSADSSGTQLQADCCLDTTTCR